MQKNQHFQAANTKNNFSCDDAFAAAAVVVAVVIHALIYVDPALPSANGVVPQWVHGRDLVTLAGACRDILGNGISALPGNRAVK